MDKFPRCGCDVVVGTERKYIRLLAVNAHTKILSTSSRTTLKQTFENPDLLKPLEELHYVFPLYEGVSVVSFAAHIGSRVIHGVVQEKSAAKSTYKQAKADGCVAGLLEQSQSAGDVFFASIGNVPAGATIAIEIEYLTDLKHDAETDAIRFTIPTKIAPRYGSSELFQADITQVSQPKQSFSVTIDAEMPLGSNITSVQSPTHPIAVQIGRLSDATTQYEPSLTRASASLSLGTAELADDFVVQIAATKLGEPCAILETHPDIPHQRALMMTLVPKFSIPTDRPEIVFVCDRSGSMGGSDKIGRLKAALNVFLKSLPLGTKFNLVSFGSHFEFLWERSQTYDQDTLDKAIAYANSFGSDFGGTKMYQPVAETFARRYKDMNLEVFLLTDGDVWEQQDLFDLIDHGVAESKGAIRLFTVGIGRNASHALIEGAARAGNGFAQFVKDDEQATTKFIRMLRASLTPHIQDYSLALKYRSTSQEAEDDGFELVETSANTLTLSDPELVSEDKQDTIPLYDNNVSDTADQKDSQADFTSKYAHLPSIATPRYVQSPYKVPALFPFSRTTAYVLLSEDNQYHLPKSLLLKGSSLHGPLELEIPITFLPGRGKTIHQMAARHMIRELEQNRGWIFHASNSVTGNKLSEEFEGRFPDMVEHKAVKLGIRHQITGKWTSFIALDAGGADCVLKGGLTEMRVVNVSSSSMTFVSPVLSSQCLEEAEESDEDMGFALIDDDAPARAASPMPQPTVAPWQQLIDLQLFDGRWVWGKEIVELLGVDREQVANAIVTGLSDDILATVASIAYLQKKYFEEKDTWAMIAEKAEEWICRTVGSDTYQKARKDIGVVF